MYTRKKYNQHNQLYSKKKYQKITDKKLNAYSYQNVHVSGLLSQVNSGSLLDLKLVVLSLFSVIKTRDEKWTSATPMEILVQYLADIHPHETFVRVFRV